MKKILKNKKGFTLVELLAVIVVLAVIILIAMPSVMNSMAKARRNSFVIEANEVIKSAQTAYAQYLMNGGGGSEICVPYKVLIDSGYIEKNDPNYTGSVKIKTSETGASTYTVWLSNKTYRIGYDDSKKQDLGVTATELTNDDAKQNENSASINCNGMTKLLTANDLK